jgi:hypothetical protein
MVAAPPAAVKSGLPLILAASLTDLGYVLLG